MPATKSSGAKSSPDNTSAIETRVDAVDWTKVYADLDTQGWSVVPKLMAGREAKQIAQVPRSLP
jgi:hypothetical protein